MSITRGLLSPFIKTYLSRPVTTLFPLRNKSTASLEDVKSVKSQENTLLVDVREPSELQETGRIPESINIPLGEVEVALRMSDEDFRRKYCKTKPDYATTIIFSCLMGKRSANAQETAVNLGFKNTKNFAGGWAEWEEKNKTS